MCGDNLCNVVLLLFVIFWVPISATLGKRAVLMLWHAFLFLGLRPVVPFPPCLVVFTAFSCKNISFFYLFGKPFY